MSIKIKPLRKFTTGTPTTSDMEVGEIAVNTADKKVFMRDDSGGDGSIVEVGASSQLFTSGATTNIDINGRVTADEFRFKDSNTLLVSADYTGSSYLVQNEIQEILSITPDGNSQNYSIFGTISAASGAFVHTLHINANLRSNTLPDLHFTQTYNEDLSSPNTRYITPILFTKETATASMKLCVKIEAQIFGIVTANLVIVARSNDQLENVTVNTTEASEFTGTPTGFTERSFTRTYVVNGGSYELQSSNATKIEATSTGVEITGYPLITAGALGTTAGDTLELLDIRATQSNTSKLRVFTERDANGTDWQSAFTRIQQIIDVTEMGYIQFNGQGEGRGMELGTEGDEKFIKMVHNGQVELYHNNNKKFETASNGVTITGKLNGLTLPAGSGTVALTSQLPSTALDDITAGNAAVSLETTTGNITIDAQGSDTDIIFKGNDGGSVITALTLDMSDTGNAFFTGGVISDRYLWMKTDNFTALYAGANFEVALTHVHNTGFKLTNAGTGTPAVELQFVDSNESIGSDGTNLLLKSGGNSITVPNTAGTVALTSDLSSYATIASPTLTGTLTTPSIRLDATGDVSPSSTAHPFQIGASNTTNIAMDSNEIMARNNGSTSLLYLNPEGGTTVIGGGIHLGGSTSTQQIAFEGTDDAFEVILKAEDATVSDKTITLPNETGTVVLGTTLFPSGTTTVGLPSPGAINLATPVEMDDHVFHPFLHNDLGHFVERGGTVSYSGLSSNPSDTSTKLMFGANGGANTIANSNFSGSTATITLTNLPKGLSYSAYVGIVFGHLNFSPDSMVIETSTNGGSSWSTRLTDSSRKTVYACTFDTGGTATNAIRFTFTDSSLSSQIRIQSIAAYNYNSAGMENYFLPLDGGTVYGDILATGGVSIGNADTTLTRNAAGSVQIEGHTILHNSNASMPSTTTSSGDADHVLINDGGFLKKISPAHLGIGSGNTAADDIAIGNAAVNLTTTTGNITIDAQGSDTDIIFKGTDNTTDITALTLDMSDEGRAIFNKSATFGDSITINGDGNKGLIIGDEALSADNDYVGMKTTNMTGSSDYMILSGVDSLGADSTFISAKSGSPVFIRGGGNDTAHQIRVDASLAKAYGILEVGKTLSSNATINKYGSSSNPIVFTVTVGSQSAAHPYYNDGSTNKYFIDGVEGAALTLHGVDTMTSNSEYYYRFDQSDGTNANHPLRFYYESNKTTLYTANVTTNGTPGQSGAYTQIAVNKDTPKTLYYQCQSHSFMGNYVTVPNSRNFGKNNTLKLETDSDIRFQHISNAHTTTLEFELPSSDKTITIPQGNNGTLIHTGNSDLPTTTTSSGDADFVLIDDGGTMKKITPANLGIGGGGGATAADDISQGNAAVNLTTTSGNITIDAQGNDTDIIFKGTDNNNDVTFLTFDGSADTALFETATTTFQPGGAPFAAQITNTSVGLLRDVFLSKPAGGADVRLIFFESGGNQLIVDHTNPASGNQTITLPGVTGTVLTTGNSDTPTTTTSSGDADFVLIDDGGTMKKITPANLGIGGGGGGSNQNAYSKFFIAGQSTVEADAVQDQVNLVGAGGISITTNASTDTITFTGSGGGSGVSEEQAIAFAVALG